MQHPAWFQTKLFHATFPFFSLCCQEINILTVFGCLERRQATTLLRRRVCNVGIREKKTIGDQAKSNPVPLFKVDAPAQQGETAIVVLVPSINLTTGPFFLIRCQRQRNDGYEHIIGKPNKSPTVWTNLKIHQANPWVKKNETILIEWFVSFLLSLISLVLSVASWLTMRISFEN